MNRFSFIIIFLITILCLSFSCEKKNPQTILDTTNTADSIIHNPLCDSIYIYQGEYSNVSEDTIINGTKYAYAMILSDKYILTFNKYNKTHGSYECLELLIDGASCEPCEENEESFHLFEPWSASPSNKFVIYHVYRKNVNEMDGETIFRFFVGKILDVETGEIAYNFYGGEAGGDWTYCDQWLVDGEVIFDPANNLE